MPKYVVIHEPREKDGWPETNPLTEVRYFTVQRRAYRYFTSLPGQAYIAQIMDEKQEGA